MEDVCCPANSVAISIPVISSSFRYLPPYTCTPKLPSLRTSEQRGDKTNALLQRHTASHSELLQGRSV